MGEASKKQMTQKSQYIPPISRVKMDPRSLIFAKLIARKTALMDEAAPLRRTEPISDHYADEMAFASLSLLQTVSFALRNHKAVQLMQVDDAIERWRRGRYGFCMECEGEIEKKRLEVMPEADLCKICQMREEISRRGCPRN